MDQSGHLFLTHCLCLLEASWSKRFRGADEAGQRSQQTAVFNVWLFIINKAGRGILWKLKLDHVTPLLQSLHLIPSNVLGIVCKSWPPVALWLPLWTSSLSLPSPSGFSLSNEHTRHPAQGHCMLCLSGCYFPTFPWLSLSLSSLHSMLATLTIYLCP